MHAEATKEHEWLRRLAGDWTFESTCSAGPDQPPMTSNGEESVRVLGGLWTIGEGRGGTPDGGQMTSIMTLGFDPARGRFVGTFVADCMTHLWVYDGSLDEASATLTLAAEGPSFTGQGTALYHDVITFLSDDVRTLTSRFRTDDGSWVEFMKATYTRKR